MKQISIQNFLNMNPQVPQYSEKNQNYLVAGANPIYYLDNGVQEEQIAPLSASIDWTQIQGTFINGNIVNMITSTQSAYSIYAISDTGNVYGITSTAIADFGYPSGAPTSDAGARLAILGGNLFATFSLDNKVYKRILPTGAWTSFGSINTACGVHLMEPFLDFIALSDGSTSTSTARVIKKIDVSAFTVSISQIDLGVGWGIIQMKNFNNKYLAIAGGQTATSSLSVGYPQNYIFLWNGTGASYQYSIKIPGQFIDMKVVDSVLYVAVKVSSGKTCLYYMAGTSLRKVFTTQLSTIFTSGGSSVPSPLFDFKNYLGVHLNSTSDISNPLLVYGKDEVGNIEFVHSYGRIFEQFAVGFDGTIFANVYNAGGNSTIWYLPATGTYQQIVYKSQWIPVKNLQAIDIYYDIPPQTVTDAINVTIYGQGENIILGSSTTVLTPITPTNYLTKKRTRLDVIGFAGDQLMIKLTTVNSDWQPIIRAIVPITK